MTEQQTITLERHCDGCTVCCEGYVTGDIHGYPMFPGRPCQFAGCSGCTIYEHRPEDPCRSFECEWLRSPADYPEWLKPSEANCIVVTRDAKDAEDNIQTCRVVIEAGSPIGTRELLFFIQQHLKTGVPLCIQVNRHWHWFGPDDWKVVL